VNERISELSVMLGAADAPQSFVCECARVGCRELLEVPLRVFYAIVRDHDDVYLVLPGHEDPEHEQTIVDHGDFRAVRTLRSDLSVAASTALRPTGSRRG
jgi:hypothetical protein